MLSLAYALVSIAAGAAQLAAGEPAAPDGGTVASEGVARATFSAEERAVSNWRGEAVQDLSPTPLSVLAVALGAERPVVTRCVKLNNYWCIKSARWNGEIGADDEGHTGFASAEHGADAAVKLLRRYYLDLDRKSALDIVRRWAPAECRIAGASGPPGVLALRGLGNTLRARWLAARARPAPRVAAAGGGAPAAARPPARRVSAVPLRPLPTFTVPSIMAGMPAQRPAAAATPPARVPPRRQPTAASVAAANAAQPPAPSRMASLAARPAASAPARAASPPRPDPAAATGLVPTASGCAPDEQRIQNYAGRMVEGLGLAPGDDLTLFDADGRPQPNLARVLLAMSGFELGYLRASVDLVEAAIARATPRAAPEEQPGAARTGPIL